MPHTLGNTNPENETGRSEAFEKYLKAARGQIEPIDIFTSVSRGDIDAPEPLLSIIDKFIAGDPFEPYDRIRFADLFEDMIDNFIGKKAVDLEDADIASMADNEARCGDETWP